MRLSNITTFFLEMTAPEQLRPGRLSRTDLSVVRIDPPLPELNRFFYTAIGGAWYWLDRLPWSYRQWQTYLDSPCVETWMLAAGGVPVGYVELDGRVDGEVEIAYFGMLPRFVGQGLGAFLLTRAVERAWSLPIRRVWVHTCTLDHPHARAHYQARGFRVYREAIECRELPEGPPGPWPGA